MGYWIQETDYLTCSDCGKYVHSYDDDGDKQIFSFCPFCGKPKEFIETPHGEKISMDKDHLAG